MVIALFGVLSASRSNLAAVRDRASLRRSIIVACWAAIHLAVLLSAAHAQQSPRAGADAPPLAEEAEKPSSSESAVAPAESADDATAIDALLSAEESVDKEASESNPLSIYGFADFTFRQFLIGENNRWSLYYPRQSSFSVGNLNVYISKEVSARLRSMAEVRFLYLPNGSEQLEGLQFVRVDTSVSDYAEFDHRLSWGGIQIVRAWVEYTFHPLITVRAGQWLTPYGIWNEDHGSPTIIPTRRPYTIAQGLVPEQQTGIEIHGFMAMTDRIEVGYNLMVSNGRGPVSTYRDLDNNKSLGARVYVQGRGHGEWRVGVYGGTDQATTTSSELVPNGKATYRRFKVDSQADYLTFAMDARWAWRAFHIQTEGVISQIAYTPGARPASPEASLITGQPGLQPDLITGGAYLLVAYRTPWLGLVPAAHLEYFRFGRPASAM